MRPNWSAAPEWANYAAQELSGNWLFHELEPRFIEITGEWRSSGRWSVVPKVTIQAKDTLESRPAAGPGWEKDLKDFRQLIGTHAYLARFGDGSAQQE